MRRGDVVIVQAGGTPASKARPCVIVQRREVTAEILKVTLCPITSRLGSPHQRPFTAPTLENGILEPSEIEVDWVFTVPVNKVKSRVGTLDVQTMHEVDHALRRWLDL